MAKSNWVIFLGLPLIFVFIIDSFPIKKSIEGKVIKVVDGDTIVVKTKYYSHVVRLSEIDAPEIKQRAWGREPIGKWSRDYLVSQILGKKVKVIYVKKDIYKRFIGEVHYFGRIINQEMIKQGMAVRSNYSRSYLYHNLEFTARIKAVGIFGTYSFDAPWTYRKKTKKLRKKGKYAANR